MKTIGYLIFSGFYYMFRLFCPVNANKVFGIMTHDGSRDGNVGVMLEYLKQQKEDYVFHTIKHEDRKKVKSFHVIGGRLSFFLIKPYHLATSKYVLLDNVFLPMAYIRFRKKVRIIQLWHGTGTIKRFGQDVNVGKLKLLEKRANSSITHLIVNSMETKTLYAKAFGVEEEKVFIYGLPRTDLFFQPDKIDERKKKFYEQFPELIGKKLILYAPTLRDQEMDHPKLALDLELFHSRLSEDFTCLLRIHPFVVDAFERDGLLESAKYENKIRNLSTYPDINTLLLVSDYLITDYSSVIFEYCLLEKPMIFYAYDLELFSDSGRGFYQSYEEYVPGPVVGDTEGIIKLIKDNSFENEKLRDFTKKNCRYMDGKSAERIYQNIFKNA